VRILSESFSSLDMAHSMRCVRRAETAPRPSYHGAVAALPLEVILLVVLGD
jgi:hypothetical protein